MREERDFMFRKRVKVFPAIFIVAQLLVVWMTVAHGHELEGITLKLGMIDAMESLEGVATNKFAEWVSKKTNDKVRVQVYPSSQLGYSISQIEAITKGALEMGQFGVGFFPPYIKDWNILTLAFLFKDQDHLKKFLGSAINKQINDQFLKQYKVRVLVENWLRPPNVIATTRPVKSLDDLKGLKIRIPGIEMYLQNWKQLGVQPTLVPWGEVYKAVQEGAVEGVDLPFDFIKIMKFHEVAPHITMTNHLLTYGRIIIHEGVYQKLPAEWQKALIEAGREAGDFYTQLMRKGIETDKEELLKLNAKIYQMDITAFREKMALLARELEGKNYWKPGLYDSIQAMAK